MLEKLLTRKPMTAINDANHLSEGDELRLAEQAVQRLLDDMAAAKLKLDRSAADADRCVADPGKVLPQELHSALLARSEALAAYDTASTRYQSALGELEKRCTEITERRVQEDAKARKEAYEKALSDYRVQCMALIKPALEVRRLGRVAGVFLPYSAPGDLLFDHDSDITVAGYPVPVWVQGSI